MHYWNYANIRSQEDETYNFCLTPFTKIISNINQAILSEFEWRPKTAQIIPDPLQF